MSLIGPRPERPENLEMLEAAIPCFSTRTAVRPGITGWAQVSSVNYAATVEETRKKVEYDFYYLAFGRPVLDLQILVRTLATVLGLRGR
jgi:lipopolysaccharide/colanic/teichoic acid biosynthesis glycosyltransferase